MSSSSTRNPTIDMLKALMSQIIVLHHLLLYTPMAPSIQAGWPSLFDWLINEGRYAVQTFLVIGGFLASKSLFKLQTQQDMRVLPVIKKRYLRLAKPFWVAIALTGVLAWWAGKIAMHREISDVPDFPQVFAHVFLLHDILGVEALSAGVWYVAIDLQLFVMLLGLVWLAKKWKYTRGLSPVHLAMLLVIAMTIASLWWWNSNPKHDEWAWYFFGAYGLGALSYWAQANSKQTGCSIAIALILGFALWIEWRERLLLTGVTALLLMHSEKLTAFMNKISRGPVQWLGDISYSVFLIHYSVAVFASSLALAAGVKGLLPNVIALLLTWAFSVGAGWVLYKLVESRS